VIAREGMALMTRHPKSNKQMPKRLYETESDVEQKFVFPLLTDVAQLGFPTEAVKTKKYLAPTVLDKAAGKSGGYYPDASVWYFGMPMLVMEVKDPEVKSEVGFREACLYARHLNAGYQTGLNPCRYVLATNGHTLLAGYWDQAQPAHTLQVDDLKTGVPALATLVGFCGAMVMEALAQKTLAALKIRRGDRPASSVGGAALLNSKKPLNSFAADLSPILRRYFSSANEENVPDIAQRAYVSSTEITEYDRVLEALLKDRVSVRRDTIVKPLQVRKNDEKDLTKAIRDYNAERTAGGQLQIIQGAVGSGKSIFARRYRQVLQPPDLAEANLWAFVDFNNSPASLKDAEQWLCECLLASLETENPNFDLYEESVLKGAFSNKIRQRRAYYEQMRKISEAEEVRARATDIAGWQSDPQTLVGGVGAYLQGRKDKNLVVVLDNVDKLELQNQLDAFQLALWLMARTKAFVILQMRDETYERYKNRPPLDTFRSGIAFHIAPPRFIDVIKRRLELGLEYLNEHVAERQEYVLDNGVRVILPKGDLGNFLKALYGIIFGRRTNVARVLEALAGKDVRRAMEMFVSIVTSGHLSTSAITSAARGQGEIPVNEYHVIRILMRGDYRFFSENSSFISNIFHYDNKWVRPDNFLLSEILFHLCMNRKHTGEIGLEGYFSVSRICDDIERMGYDREDVFNGVNYLLRGQLIGADNYNSTHVERDQCVKAEASGFMHLRVLCERIEYLYGVLATTPISDAQVVARIADFTRRENDRNELSARERVLAIEAFLGFLQGEMKRLREKNPFFSVRQSGAAYVIRSMEMTVNRFYRVPERLGAIERNPLDLI
jgi:hypothetical protein